MTTDTLTIELQMSKTYLILSIAVYLLCLFAIWYYLPQLWLNIVTSGILSLWFYYFLPKNVLGNQASTVRKITFAKNRIILEKNDQSTQQYAWCTPVYQSPFLIIFEFGKQRQLVIFRDSTKDHSLSSINRTLYAQR